MARRENISDYDTTSVQGGSVVNTITGRVHLQPTIGYEGGDSFSYTISDVDATRCDTGTLTVTEMDGISTTPPAQAALGASATRSTA
jgi:hypothetical protein